MEEGGIPEFFFYKGANQTENFTGVKNTINPFFNKLYCIKLKGQFEYTAQAYKVILETGYTAINWPLKLEEIHCVIFLVIELSIISVAFGQSSFI